ncbi:Com family DNA-binding transcriptional regulator [Cohaesibacter sp. ES.047]|uniref:Com family DNA-binding transcriptional regulator n=1 Tax=Cohaesibacter sp. ES.047 TaxID=1798205 RepID=UPI000BB738F8
MESIRCSACQALLFKTEEKAISGRIEIKCRRCRTINHLRPAEPETDCLEQPAIGEKSCGSMSHSKP